MRFLKRCIFLLIPLLLLCLFGCGKTCAIGITVPAQSTGIFYSDEEISPIRNRIAVSCGEGLGDTGAILMPVEVKEENAYDEAAYLTPGMSSKMEAEKGAWFRIGVSFSNGTDSDQTVYVNVKGIRVRIR